MKDNAYYFKKELAYLYEQREQFVKRFPKLAPFLGHNSKDPDVERIIENLALLSAKIHEELDQNIPYIAESLINIVAPNYTNALPSLCMQEFILESNSKENYCYIPKGSNVYATPLNRCVCTFKSVYDVHLYPLNIDSVILGSEKQYYTMDLTLNITKENLQILDLNLQKIHLYLGDDAYTSTTLLLYLHYYLQDLRILCKETNESFKLGSHALKAMGLSGGESMLSYNDLGFEAFSLLREYFFLPQKFNFIAIENLEILKDCKGKSFVLEFRFSKPLPKYCLVRKEIFSLSATPIINIFEKSAEPFIHHHNKDSYRIFMDQTQQDAYEIIQVKQVKAHSGSGGRRILKNYKNFERFEFLEDMQQEFYALANKIDSKGISYKEISFINDSAENATISIDTLCSNGNLPRELKIGAICQCDFKSVQTKNIVIPSSMRKVAIDGNLLWKFVSILSFNYQTMLDKTAFFSVLESYGFIEEKENAEICERLKQSITKIENKSTYLVDGYITKRGIKAIFSIKDSLFYSLGEVYQLGLVLSQFFSSFAGLNTFCILEIVCLDSKDIFEYPAISGKKALL